MFKKSIGLNTLLNLLKTMGTYIFPMITYPYVFRVLQAEGVGKYNYSFSIISYFVLIACLGISTYAIREGAKVREDKSKINRFVSEIMGVSCISTLISYILMMLTVFGVSQLHEYKKILFVLAPVIAANTFNMEWVLNIYEDFLFVTIRTFFINVCALVATFLFVKSIEDIYIYTFIHMIQLVVIAILNIIYVKRYIKLGFCFSGLKKHVKPILLLFSMSIAIQIYVNVDTTMLGYLKGDTVVGLYNAANKIYSIMKTAIVAIVTTFVPRMTAYMGKSNKERNVEKYKKYLMVLIEIILTFSVPLSIGVILFNREIISIISGEDYLNACDALRILSMAMPICCLSTCLNTCVLIINDDEKRTLWATIAGAILNLVLNIYFIPTYAQNGAAITTLCAEFLVLIIVMASCLRKYRYFFDLRGIGRAVINSIVYGLIVVMCYRMMINIIDNRFVLVFSTGCLSMLCLILYMYFTKNKMIKMVLQNIKGTRN